MLTGNRCVDGIEPIIQGWGVRIRRSAGRVAGVIGRPGNRRTGGGNVGHDGKAVSRERRKTAVRGDAITQRNRGQRARQDCPGRARAAMGAAFRLPTSGGRLCRGAAKEEPA